MSVQEICRVAENTQLGDGLFLMVLHAPKITELAQCGQFVHIACGEGHLLRRPISICAWKAPELRIVFQVKGEGTKWLSERRTGDELDVLGPLGHGFDVGALGSAPVFIGGGIGVPPMLGCVREAVKQGAKPAIFIFSTHYLDIVNFKQYTHRTFQIYLKPLFSYKCLAT